MAYTVHVRLERHAPYLVYDDDGDRLVRYAQFSVIEVHTDDPEQPLVFTDRDTCLQAVCAGMFLVWAEIRDLCVRGVDVRVVA
jgi:hypothetical protein